jgi:hypothetical protein
MDRSISFFPFTANVKYDEVNTYSNWLGHSYRLRVERDKMLITLKPMSTRTMFVAKANQCKLPFIMKLTFISLSLFLNRK